MKDSLCYTSVLPFPDPNQQLVLSQKMDGQATVLAYYNKTLSKPERNYCITRQQVLAVSKIVQHSHSCLYGKPFLLYTDHISLKWISKFKNLGAQMARWVQLEAHHFTVEHRAGRVHGNADALSRQACGQNYQHCQKTEQTHILKSTNRPVL